MFDKVKGSVALDFYCRMAYNKWSKEGIIKPSWQKKGAFWDSTGVLRASVASQGAATLSNAELNVNGKQQEQLALAA